MTVATMEEVVLSHQRLVHKIANQFAVQAARVGIQYDDLCSAGRIGLMRAWHYFKPKMDHYRFSTFAVPLIRFEIYKLFNDDVRLIRISRFTLRIIKSAHRLGILERPAREIAATLSVKENAVILALRAKHMQPVSLQQPVAEKDGNEVFLEEIVGDAFDASGSHVKDFLSRLPERERKIIAYRLQGLHQTEIAVLFSLKPNSICRIIQKIGRKWLAYERGERLKHAR